jgi:hypothetical protein
MKNVIRHLIEDMQSAGPQVRSKTDTASGTMTTQFCAEEQLACIIKEIGEILCGMVDQSWKEILPCLLSEGIRGLYSTHGGSITSS